MNHAKVFCVIESGTCSQTLDVESMCVSESLQGKAFCCNMASFAKWLLVCFGDHLLEVVFQIGEIIRSGYLSCNVGAMK